ncbi:heterokaryon incompatibility protein-domain-containing protein [Xylariaceae sp. FL1272]|nr:heterokaryon incompatibility protein-domain-containing protein [Xylariaceae sp. FL1272]
MEYQTLDYGSFETRFLRLQAIHPNGFMEFEVVVASMSNPPNYYALSYRWGDTSQRAGLIVNGRHIDISMSLGEALASIDLTPGVLIWADAICINQNDLYEKSYQVRMMGLIYTKAQSTVSWVGRELPGIQHAHTLCAEIQRLAADDEDDQLRASYFSKALRCHQQPVRALYALHDLLSQPYWERVWIIQELIKAKSVEVRCGSFSFSLETLLWCSSRLKNFSSRAQSLLDAVKKFKITESTVRHGGRRISLLEAMITTRHFFASDERDKVYALLGLTRDGNDLVPIPTYTMQAQELFESLTVAILHSPQQALIPLLSSRAPLRSRFPCAPSWAVDWTDLALTLPPWLTLNCEKVTTNSLFDIKGTTNPSINSEYSIHLVTEGRPIGIICSTTDTTEFHEGQDSTEGDSIARLKKTASNVLKSICNSLLLKPAPIIIAGKTILETECIEALARLIVCGKHFTAWGVPDMDHVIDQASQLGEMVFSEWSLSVLAAAWLLGLGPRNLSEASDRKDKRPNIPTSKARKFSDDSTTTTESSKDVPELASIPFSPAWVAKLGRKQSSKDGDFSPASKADETRATALKRLTERLLHFSESSPGNRDEERPMSPEQLKESRAQTPEPPIPGKAEESGAVNFRKIAERLMAEHKEKFPESSLDKTEECQPIGLKKLTESLQQLATTRTRSFVIPPCRLPPAAFDLWQDVFSSLNATPENGLVLANVSFKSHWAIVLARRGTAPGDQLYWLNNFPIPLVLRDIGDGQFALIGEVCTGPNPDKQWIAAKNIQWLKEKDSVPEPSKIQIDLGHDGTVLDSEQLSSSDELDETPLEEDLTQADDIQSFDLTPSGIWQASQTFDAKHSTEFAIRPSSVQGNHCNPTPMFDSVIQERPALINEVEPAGY